MEKIGYLGWAQSFPRRKGRAEFIKYLKGGRLTARQAIDAACIRCSTGYETGLGCTVPDCPLLPFNPYNLTKKKADLTAVEAV